MKEARRLLEQFARDRKADRISDDLAALDSHPMKSEGVTDMYLANLAAKHSARFGTFEQTIAHAAVEVIG